MKVNSQYVSLKAITEAQGVEVDNSEAFLASIEKAHGFLKEEIKKGKPIYGITTGYGASGKNYVDYEDARILQNNLFLFHGCGVGEPLSEAECKTVLIARMVSLAKGCSGVSYALLKRFELLVNKGIVPVIPSKGSVGASGDLTPLSYVAAVIAGGREVYYQGEIRDTKEVYELLGIQPYVFEPKEALAVMNGTSAMSAIAVHALRRFEHMVLQMEAYVAGMYEVLLCDYTPLEQFVHDAKPFEGQRQSAANILKNIQGSKLTRNREGRYGEFFDDADMNIQDHYSLRCVPQIMGVIRDNLELSKQWVEKEINSVNDNPIIDGENRKIYTSGNFYGGYVAHAMDTLKICAANLADLLDKEFALLVDVKFNRGLGENLKLSDKPYHHGFKAMQITMSSLSADVIKNTTAASIHSRPTESLNQDKVSMGTTAALDFKKMLPDLHTMLAIGYLGLAQAVDIRGEDQCSERLRSLHQEMRALSGALIEDRRLDVDIKKVVAYLEGV